MANSSQFAVLVNKQSTEEQFYDTLVKYILALMNLIIAYIHNLVIQLLKMSLMMKIQLTFQHLISL